MLNRSPDLTDEQRLQQLEELFAYLSSRVGNPQNADTLFTLMSEESREWFVQLEDAIRYESREDLEKRPFYEILTISAVRLLERNHELNRIDTLEILKTTMGKYGILARAFNLQNLGPIWVENESGEYFGYRGMKGAEKVPVYFFIWEEFAWKLDLPRMLPIVSRGLETIGRKSQWSQTETVIHLLKNTFSYQVDESLFEPR